jgi:site-specific recombinase XerD
MWNAPEGKLLGGSPHAPAYSVRSKLCDFQVLRMRLGRQSRTQQSSFSAALLQLQNFIFSIEASALTCAFAFIRQSWSSTMQDIQYSLNTQQPNLTDLIQRANALMNAAKANSTRKAYRTDWRDFESWCSAHQLPSLPSTPETVSLYIADCVSRLAPATISRRLASITKAHQAAGFENSPASTKHFVVCEVLKGARRTLGVAQKGKDPLLLNDVRRIIDACPPNLLGLRDRSLVLIGFAGAFRRSELASLYMSDLTFSSPTGGVVVHLRHSKTDQEGAGREVAIPPGEHAVTCPVRTLREWIQAIGIKDGAVFRGIDRHGHISKSGLHPDSIGTIVKRAAARAGLDATNLAGHSMRSGMATQAAMNGAGERSIAKTTGRKSRRILRRYIRSGQLFQENASANLGL